MKYIMKFEKSSSIYKDGDIVVLDLYRIKHIYEGDEDQIEFLNKLGRVQRIFDSRPSSSRNVGQYYLISNDWDNGADENSNFWYLEDNEILRKATEEEVEKFLIDEKSKKYNV